MPIGSWLKVGIAYTGALAVVSLR